MTRGYGGALKGPCLVDPVEHLVIRAVGDEALLAAGCKPTGLSHDRPAGALAAGEAGAEAIIMDDGFQNPSIGKTLSFLLIDAEDPAGNGRVFPAGPLREPEAEEALTRRRACLYS
ncbi:MAG: tetraacyldisaccharide 4'-kinase [Parvularculaceae bacterium]